MFVHDKNVYAALAIFIALGCCYIFCTPLWVPPSESTVFSYCEYMARNKKLPDVENNTSGTAPRITQAFHPPLYFFMCSLFIDPGAAPLQEAVTVNDGPGHAIIVHPAGELSFPFSATVRTAYILRLFTLLLSSLTIYGIYAITLCMYPGNRALAAVASLLAAANPQFLHVAGSISNEGPVSALTTIFLLMLLRQIVGTPSFSESIAAGFVMGAALLTKSSALFVLPLTAGLCLLLPLEKGMRLFRNILAIITTGLAVAGWWYVDNWSMLRSMNEGMPWYIRHAPLTTESIVSTLRETCISFLGFFGALQVPLSRGYLVLYGLLGLFGFTGSCRAVLRQKPDSRTVKAWALLACAFIMFSIMYIVYNWKFYACEGKYFFVVIGPVAIFFASGLMAFFPSQQKKIAAFVICCLLIVLSVDVLVRILKPAFAAPRVDAVASQQEFSSRTEPLCRATVGQTFLCTSPGLCGVRILAASRRQSCGGDVVFVLQDEKTDGLLCRISMPLKFVDETAWYYFAFPPIARSKGLHYRFNLFCDPPCAPADIALWYAPDDTYRYGSLFIDGNSVPGDLYFEAYCLNGDKPGTVWEGLRAVAIKQRQYIDVVELERYQELPEYFRVQSSTAEKIRKFEAAASYGHVQ